MENLPSDEDTLDVEDLEGPRADRLHHIPRQFWILFSRGLQIEEALAEASNHDSFERLLQSKDPLCCRNAETLGSLRFFGKPHWSRTESPVQIVACGIHSPFLQVYPLPDLRNTRQLPVAPNKTCKMDPMVAAGENTQNALFGQ